MSCRPTTYVPVQRDRQHAVFSPKIHRRSSIHSPLPCHRARSDRFKLCRHYTRAILATGRAGSGEGNLGYIHSESQARRVRATERRRGNNPDRRRCASLCPQATRRALFLPSVKQTKTAVVAAVVATTSSSRGSSARRKNTGRDFFANPDALVTSGHLCITDPFYFTTARRVSRRRCREQHTNASRWHTAHSPLFTRARDSGARARARSFIAKFAPKTRRERGSRTVRTMSQPAGRSHRWKIRNG